MKALLAFALFAATPAGAAPLRVASLNLCSDELALLLAGPGQLVSVSRLAADPEESLLAARAKSLPTNRGRVTDVVALAPDLVLTSGGDPTVANTARRLGIATLELPQPQNFIQLRDNIHIVAEALGRPAAGIALTARMDAILASSPARLSPALLVSGGGITIAADGFAAQWLAAAGLSQQRVPRGQINLEQILRNPPRYLVISTYRAKQASANQRWLAHPAFAALPASVHQLHTDGRAWTCLGPGLATEIARLRAVVAATR
jgi:iron complex transport system substrate-binding protein